MGEQWQDNGSTGGSNRGLAASPLSTEGSGKRREKAKRERSKEAKEREGKGSERGTACEGDINNELPSTNTSAYAWYVWLAHSLLFQLP